MTMVVLAFDIVETHQCRPLPPQEVPGSRYPGISATHDRWYGVESLNTYLSRLLYHVFPSPQKVSNRNHLCRLKCFTTVRLTDHLRKKEVFGKKSAMVAWIIEVNLSLTHLWCDVKVLIVAMEDI